MADDFGTVTHYWSVAWRMEGQSGSYFGNASLIDSDSFQVSCRFPDLLTCA